MNSYTDLTDDDNVELEKLITLKSTSKLTIVQPIINKVEVTNTTIKPPSIPLSSYETYIKTLEKRIDVLEEENIKLKEIDRKNREMLRVIQKNLDILKAIYKI